MNETVLKQLESINQSMPISRRALLRRALVAGAAIPAVAGLLAACGDDDAVDPAAPGLDDDVEEADDDTDTTADGPRRGGTLRIGFAGSPDTFDPHHPVQFEGIWVQSMLYSRLVRINADMELEPDLAHTWELSEDGTAWTFHLRDDVVFHNGRQFTAEDVKFSWDRMVDPDEGTPIATQVAIYQETEVVSDTEVVLHLSGPYADFALLAGMYYSRIVPSEAVDNLATEPVGTGPYKLRSHSPGERTVLERFEDYFNADNEAWLDEIHYITIPEDTSRIAALTGETIEFINEVPPTSIPVVERAPNLVTEEVATGSYQPVVMIVEYEPFDDVRVRQALKLVLDRDQYLQAVLQGHGVTANDQPIPPVDPMHADLPIPQRNVERAIELLEEAGFDNGLDLELHTTPGRVGLLESALSVQEMGQAANIRIEVTSHPVDSYWAEVWLQLPFHMSNWSARPMADQAFTAAYLRGSTWNESRWHNDRFEELVLAARETFDEDERREMYREAQEILSEDGGSIIPYFLAVNGSWNQRMRGYQMHPLRWVDLHNVWLEDA
jgi:peptide/nickel transport system substrate-binding protein